MKWILSILIAIAIAIALALSLVAVRSGLFEISLEDLRAKYSTSDSRFMDIDGVRVHYMDQGSGPPVLLLHASFMDLRTWDSMAEALAPNHRVVRLDFLTAGLTGPDPKQAYSVERNMELAEGLMDALGLDQFAVICTSSGAVAGWRYTAENPDRVTRLVIMNSAGMPRTVATNPNRLRGTRIGRWLRSQHQTRAFVRKNLDRNFIEPHEPPEWLVEMSYDNIRRENRKIGAGIFRRNFRTGGTEAVLGRITVPTMILWGLENVTVMHLEADVFQHWLLNAPTLKKKYPGVGHYLYLEIPDEVEIDIGAFLSGARDHELRRVQVIPATAAAN